MPPFLNWALAHATWDGLSRKACAPDGACWAFVRARFGLFIYGRYPQPERWRVDVAMVLLAGGASPARCSRRAAAAGGCSRCWCSCRSVGWVLLIGGVFGLPHVDTGDWGGLMLNVVLTFVAVVGFAAARHPARVRTPVGTAGAALVLDRLH